jgi:hypothetical protein
MLLLWRKEWGKKLTWNQTYPCKSKINIPEVPFSRGTHFVLTIFLYTLFVRNKVGRGEGQMNRLTGGRLALLYIYGCVKRIILPCIGGLLRIGSLSSGRSLSTSSPPLLHNAVVASQSQSHITTGDQSVSASLHRSL